ncbi:hypothetical protein GCM10007096_15300 [Pullulanibacillus pueri]|uniref:Na+/H+ antiporter NhaC-like C-terminal domain-containing protein n=1 Tax=Pullulanibacillus pueri TaxID=1437324 RepID=A0A8J3ELT1_9BACL|nr:hypothetical protein GCM10007096_15300 [Pullulanibacillus pueri]
MLSTMDQLFNLNILLLIPPVIVLVGSIMKKSPLIVLFISSLAAMILALCFQHVSLSNLFTATVEGFNVDILKETIPSLDPSIITDDVASLLNRGGLYSMYNSTAFIFYAFFFASALEVSGSLKAVLQHIIKYLRSTGSIVFATLVTGFATICCTSNALVTFFLIKDIYGDIYKAKGLHPVNLSRSMEDSVTITEVLMPWTVSGVFIATTLGVDNFTFLPWAIFNLGGFVFSALYAFLSPLTRGFGIRKLEKREGSNSTDPGQTPSV